MQAIITKYLCPTDHRGARIKAKCEAMTVVLPWDHALNPEDNHREACRELCKRMDARNVTKYGQGAAQWTTSKVTGQLPSGEYVHVFTKVGGCYAQWE